MDDETVDISSLANMVYANLCAVSPQATKNMVSNITMEDLGDRYVITISRGVPYARYTNENWGKRSAESKANYIKRRLHKERDNYRWVERSIEHTLMAMYGKGSVVNEL